MEYLEELGHFHKQIFL